jgi:hypothetical protein
MSKEKLSEMQNVDLANKIEKLIISSAKDFDQPITGDDIKHMLDKSYFVIRMRYNSLTWDHILSAFEQGMSDKWGKCIKLTQKNIYSWLRHVKAESINSISSTKVEPDDEMPIKTKLVELYRMAERREKETEGKKPNPFKSFLWKMGEKAKMVREILKNS